jgi:hypothetical protein
MNYAVELIIKEISILEKCLIEWETELYPEAKKERDKRLKELNEALNKIKNEN